MFWLADGLVGCDMHGVDEGRLEKVVVVLWLSGRETCAQARQIEVKVVLDLMVIVFKLLWT